MRWIGKALHSATLSVSLCSAGCTSSPDKDLGATAIGAGAGVAVCVVTLVACPVVLMVGAGGGMLIRKANVSRYNNCMLQTPRANFKAREVYCSRE
jgi:hypothetical protein